MMVSSTLALSPPASATGQLVFRICGSCRDGQTVRIRSPKCTVGAGPRCTLRLRAPGVGPMHCLIVRGRRATIARCWSADTRLNGQAFTDAKLLPGDHLSIGAIELELVAVEEEELVLGAARQQIEKLDTELAAQPAEESSEKSSEEPSEEPAVAQALPAREQSPAPEPEEASAAQSEPDPVLAADSEPSPDTESPSSGAEAEPAVPMSAGDTAEAPVNLADVLRRVGADAVLSDDADTPDEPPPRRAAGRAAAETPATPPHDDGGEESINQYMERLMQRVRGGTASETSARWAQSPASSASSDSRRSTETEATPAEPRHARARATDAKPAAPRDTESSQIVPAEPRQRPTGNMSPRTVAPEKGGGLAAMRELAQYTAHNALNQHARNQLVTTIRTKLLVTLLGLGTGVALFWLHRRPGANQTALYAAVVSLMVAVIWGIQYATLTGHLIVRKVGRIEWKWSTSAAPQVPAAGTPGD